MARRKAKSNKQNQVHGLKGLDKLVKSFVNQPENAKVTSRSQFNKTKQKTKVKTEVSVGNHKAEPIWFLKDYDEDSSK